MLQEATGEIVKHNSAGLVILATSVALCFIMVVAYISELLDNDWIFPGGIVCGLFLLGLGLVIWG